MVPSITNNSINQQSFVYTRLNDKAVLFLTIQFSISFVCAQFKFQTVLFDPWIGPDVTIPGQSGPGSDGNEGGTQHSPKLLHYRRLTISLFSVLSRTLIEEWGSYPSAEMQSVYSTAPADRAVLCKRNIIFCFYYCLAKAAINITPDKNIKTSYTDLRPKIKQILTKKWQQLWEENPHNRLFQIQPNFKRKEAGS